MVYFINSLNQFYILTPCVLKIIVSGAFITYWHIFF